MSVKCWCAVGHQQNRAARATNRIPPTSPAIRANSIRQFLNRHSRPLNRRLNATAAPGFSRRVFLNVVMHSNQSSSSSRHDANASGVKGPHSAAISANGVPSIWQKSSVRGYSHWQQGQNFKPFASQSPATLRYTDGAKISAAIIENSPFQPTRLAA